MLLEIYTIFISIVFIGMLAIDLVPYFRPSPKGANKGANFNPKVLVIVPCRGIDLTLEENLRSIKVQDYPNYKMVAVVDSKNDPAVEYIKKLGIEMIVSDYKAKNASGKVRAILSALSHYRKFDAYVIADSDITAGKGWLRGLIVPLASNKVGISTTYPKFIPKGGFWSKVKSVWGFVGEGLMESQATIFGWGGSLAFRSDLMDREAIEFLANSRYSVSDDICLTKIAKSRGLAISYVSKAQPQVYLDDDFGRFIEWSNRQVSLSILGYRENLYYGIAFYSAEILLFLSGILMALFISPIFLILLIHFLKSETKTYSRAQSRDPTIFFIVLAMPFFYLPNILAASRIRSITWRGREYRIRG